MKLSLTGEKKSILKIDKNIQNIENEMTYFFITNSNLKNKKMIEQIHILSKLNHKIGFLFDLYRDYALFKSNFKNF